MKITTDSNTAVASIAYNLSEIIPIYPITPSSPMAEYSAKKSSNGKTNIFGEKVTTVEMQSEAGVAGAMHGALIGGAMCSTFTSSQGLLLMIPDMYKMAGECLPGVIHVAARSVASHALSIFGDHSDVMSVRMTGFTMLSSSNVQEAQDMALIAHTLAYTSNMPVLHFFDGFRTSHEFQKIEAIEENQIKKIFPLKEKPTNMCLSSSSPRQYGTAQNPDVFFQNREAREINYEKIKKDIDGIFKNFEDITGRKYNKFDYFGDKNAENIIVIMGSGSETFIDCLNNANQKAGLIKVRLYRPFDEEAFVKTLPKNTRKIIVLDRTIESGARGPLFLDVKNALSNKAIQVVGGKYGIGGKEFSPTEAMAVLENFNKMQDDFTVGITDDVRLKSLPIKQIKLNLNQTEIKIFGLGSDGSVSASKSITKILGEKEDNYVQGYFEYDSKKSGSMTISHLRISSNEIHSTYLCKEPNIIMINNFSFVHKYNCLEGLKENGVVIFNTVFEPEELDKILPLNYKKQLLDCKAKIYVINAHKIANELGLKEKINMIMTSAFFTITKLKKNFEKELYFEIEQNFLKKGEDIVNKNKQAVSMAKKLTKSVNLKNINMTETAIPIKLVPDFNCKPVSFFSKDGSIETDTSKFEKRCIAEKISEWQPKKCLQCGQCVLACPHGAIKAILVKNPPEDVPFVKAYGIEGYYRIQVSPEDCTGCGLCQEICPALGKAIIMKNASEVLEKEKTNFKKVETLKKIKKTPFSKSTVKGLQFEQNYFIFPGACAGCGETPYIKLASMLFGHKMVIANATGCSSIYGGSYPSCPYSKNENGKGPAWANSLFEDNAEFGLGIKLAKEKRNSSESVWIIGGDGWAYDIGFGGLDHVLASGKNVNILVLDNECYANTGGQSSKSTPAGASVKLADGGKETNKKNLGLMALSYGNVYVASVAIGADMNQCIKAFREAEAYNGPSLIIAYSTCVNHGFEMSKSLTEMKKAVDAGYVTLYRYHPVEGFKLDSEQISNKFIPFLIGERRYAYLMEKYPEKAKKLFKRSKEKVKENIAKYKQMERTSGNN